MGGFALASVIVVEDDADLRDGLVECLRLAGLHTRGVGSAIEFYQELAMTPFDIAVLDVNLPDKDGYSIGTFLSEKTALGIIFMTGRGQDEDRIRGFSSGADLYFVKPVNTKELVLAVKNLARRLGVDTPIPAEGGTEPDDTSLAWVLDRVRWRLTSPQLKTMQLTAKEVQLIERLAVQGGTPVPRQELLKVLGHDALQPESRGLDAAIGRLRRKAVAFAQEPLPIHTVQSVGFLFVAPIRVI